MEKDNLSLGIKMWLELFLEKKFSAEMDLLEVLIPESNLSKLPNSHVKSMANYSSWEFKPDLIGILKHKKSGIIRLAIANRTTSSTSLKEIGELHTYAKVLDAEFAIVISTNGPSNEVNILLLEQSIRDRLLQYKPSKSMFLATWDGDKNEILQNSVLPLEYRNKL
jgi:hypothetical protein